jgi:hypothetical protein
MSKLLAHSALYRWFCRCDEFVNIKVPGKSCLQDYASWLSAAEVEEVLTTLMLAVSDEEQARIIGLENELDMSAAWVDSTCVEANIQFPTDWTLMRSAARTIVKSVETIRRHGLHKRIAEPASFLRAINVQAMKMSAAGRKPGGKKERKKILREMKRISITVEKHGRRYREALDKDWEQTDLTRKEAEVILRRLDNVIEQLPEARRQAHERIIGGRLVDNEEKILSLYEKDIHVVVRGKASANIEYGNSLFLAETKEGFIFDHELRKEGSPGDAKWLKERYATMQEKSRERLQAVTADRGFDSSRNKKYLEDLGQVNNLCPRDPKQLEERIKTDTEFARAQRRRAQTEARVGIIKNVFLDGTPRAKGFENRQLQVTWAVLAHNLWVLARLPWAEDIADQALAA